FANADEIIDKAALAIEGKLTAQDLRVGTITIRNIGSVGGGWFTPVINFPEVAFFGGGSISKQTLVYAFGLIRVGTK
ncbi:2-oxo acid dehydrogenase subunit E2, partial [Enterococcus faecalis]|uniref:2-oxo acid dehydrogenase subunit E2 n=1 Tax=Enterococcus faecalis TaxID=1351 RepID=UPI003CC5C0F1